MSQFGRPDSDITQTNWSGGFGTIDEASYSDADFITGVNSANGTAEYGFSDVTDPASSSGHVVRFRAWQQNNTKVRTLNAYLYQGATLKSSYPSTITLSKVGAQAYEWTLSSGEADAITDYTDLRVRFVSGGDVGVPSSGRSEVYVSWAELETPDTITDDLTSAGITTGAPSVAAPTIGQIHALTSAGITTGAAAVAAPTIGQVHALTSAGIATSAPTLGAPTLAEPAAGEDTLTAAGITTGTPGVASPTIGQKHALTSAGITTSAPTLGAAAIGQKHALGTASLYDVMAATEPQTYWPLKETSGTAVEELIDNLDGTYYGATLGQIAAPGGGLAPLFDGNDYAALITAGLAARFNGALGSAVVWWQMLNQAVWADGSVDVIFEVYVNTNNYVRIAKDAVTNKLSCSYCAGGVQSNAVTYDLTAPGWHLSVITWDKANDEVKVYGDNAQIGATLTGLGTWAGSIVSCTVGRWNAYLTFYLQGYPSEVGIWDRVLTPTEIAAIYAAGLVLGITTGAPSVAAPTIGQKHALTSAGIVTGTPVLGAPTLVSVAGMDNLTSAGITTSQPTLGAPTIAQKHALSAAGITTSAPTLGAPPLAQHHALTAAGIVTGTPVLGAPAIAQVHILTAGNITTAAPVFGAPTLTESNFFDNLFASGITTGGPTLGTPIMVVGGISPDRVHLVEDGTRTHAAGINDRVCLVEYESRS